MRRFGELLKQFDARGGDTGKTVTTVGSASQRQVAERAGMSERQQVTAVRVANIPEQSFYRKPSSSLVVARVQILNRYRHLRGLSHSHARPFAVFVNEYNASGFESGSNFCLCIF